MNCLLEKQRRVVVRTHSKLKVERRIGPYQPFCQLRTDIYNNNKTKTELLYLIKYKTMFS